VRAVDERLDLDRAVFAEGAQIAERKLARRDHA